MNSCITGFNGERRDPISGTTSLGNGYRSYQPAFFRFNAPDSFSPFGAGGVNPYAYCVGDPINRADPSGHMGIQGWLGIGMGIIGLGLAIFSVGTSIAAAGGILAAIESASAMSLVTGVAGALSDVAAIASGAAEGNNPQASAILGWVSVGAGMIGMLHSVSGLAGKLGGLSKRSFGSLMAGGIYASGQFRNPRYLGTSTGNITGFDFLFEDVTPQGLRRLNIMSQEEIQYGHNPALVVNMWNEAERANQTVLYSSLHEPQSVLEPYFLDQTGNRYQVYRFGTDYAANTRRIDGFSPESMPRGFAKHFSLRMQGSLIEVSRREVTYSGSAFEDLDYAIREINRSGDVISATDGQEILNLIAQHWGEHSGAFMMTSDSWVTYFNGRLNTSRRYPPR